MKKTHYFLQVKENLPNILWFVFIIVFLLAGITGHDPWKQDETYSFGIIYHFYTTHSWLVPVNAGVPFMEKPPLYYWTAVIFCKMIGNILPLPDATRLTSVFYMLVAVLFLWKSSQVIFKNSADSKALEWISVALFLGTLGVVRHAHDMFTDVALLAGTTIAMYGMAKLACEEEKFCSSGIWFGLGIGVTFLSKGLFMPVILSLNALILCIVLPKLHRWKTGKALLAALIVSAPFLIIWPLLLYHDSPSLFMAWFWENNLGRFLGFSVAKLGAPNAPYYILYSALWFAFPTFPLAVAMLIRGRKKWKAPEYLIPACIAITGLLFLLLSASARALYLLPLLPAFSLLSAPELIKIPKRILAIWNSIALGVYSLIVIMLWVIWWCLLYAPYNPLAAIYGKILPLDFTPSHTQYFAFILSAIATDILLNCWKLDRSDAVNTAKIWFAGIGSVWILSYTLFLPWIDETKSYRPVITQLNQFAETSPFKGSCINTINLGESIAPMFEYFGTAHTLNPTKDFQSATCPLMLTVTGKAVNNAEHGWKLVWKASRELDAKDEELRLYARNK